MKMMDMKQSKEQAKKMSSPAMTSGKQDEFPYGLRITLNDDQLKKLEHIAGYNVGDEVQIMAVGSVVSKDSRETQDGKADRSMIIQIKKLGCEMEDDSKMDDTKWYQKKKRG